MFIAQVLDSVPRRLLSILRLYSFLDNFPFHLDALR